MGSKFKADEETKLPVVSDIVIRPECERVLVSQFGGNRPQPWMFKCGREYEWHACGALFADTWLCVQHDDDVKRSVHSQRNCWGCSVLERLAEHTCSSHCQVHVTTAIPVRTTLTNKDRP